MFLFAPILYTGDNENIMYFNIHEPSSLPMSLLKTNFKNGLT